MFPTTEVISIALGMIRQHRPMIMTSGHLQF